MKKVILTLTGLAGGIILALALPIQTLPIEFTIAISFLLISFYGIFALDGHEQFWMAIGAAVGIWLIWLYDPQKMNFQSFGLGLLCPFAALLLDYLYDPGWRHTALRSVLAFLLVVFCLIQPDSLRVSMVDLMAMIILFCSAGMYRRRHREQQNRTVPVDNHPGKLEQIRKLMQEEGTIKRQTRSLPSPSKKQVSSSQ